MIWTAGPDFHHFPITPHLFQPNASIFSAISLLTPCHTHTHTSSPEDYLGLFPNPLHPLQSPSFGFCCSFSCVRWSGFNFRTLIAPGPEPCISADSLLPSSSTIYIAPMAVCCFHSLLLAFLSSPSSSSHVAAFPCEIPLRCSS